MFFSSVQVSSENGAQNSPASFFCHVGNNSLEARMTIHKKIINLAAGVFFILMLIPGTAHLQEQTPPAQQPEKPAAESAPQQSGQLITPDDATAAEVENQNTNPEAVANEKNIQPTASEETPTLPTKEKTTYYTVKRGDTLWDISGSFLKDPFLWPFIWKANPSITNPDLIYPGNKLAIPSLAPIERALKAPAEKEKSTEKKTEQVAQQEPRSREGVISPESGKQKPAEIPTEGRRLILPEEQPIPIIDKYAMLSAGFVDSMNAEGRIVGSPEDAKTTFGFGDTVYVKLPSSQPAAIGDKFLVFTTVKKVNHPRSGKRYGTLVRGLGILQITAKNASDVFTAKITLSFDSMEKNNILTPYQEPALVFNSQQQRDKEITGYILDVVENHTINAQLDFVYLDKGNVDGVEPGDRFAVYSASEKKSLPKKKIGEVQVFIVKNNSATAVVRKSNEPIVVGDLIEFRK